MPPIKFDVSGSDPERASQSFEPPKPGVYTAKVAEINPGFSKGSDGKPDKAKPRIEVVYHIVDGDYKNAPVWDYLTQWSPDAMFRLDQFLQAVGVATKSKRKGQFDPDAIIGKRVKLRIKGDTNLEGEYKAKVGGVMPAPDEDEDYGEDGEGEDTGDEEETGGEEDEEPAEDEAETETEAVDYSTMSIKDLRIELKSRELETTGPRPALISRLEENDAESVETVAEEEEAVEEPDDGYNEMSIKDLREELASRELDTKGPKDALIKRLRENDEEPF